MATTFALSTKPTRITVYRNCNLKGDHQTQDYIHHLNYEMTCTDGTYTIHKNLTGVGTESVDKDRADFVAFNDLTECPTAIYAQITEQFNDVNIRAKMEELLEKEKFQMEHKDCPW